MSRVDFLPEEELSNRLLELRKNLDEIKTLQFIGSDMVRNYLVSSADQWDTTSSTSGSGAGAVAFHDYRLTFTPDTDNVLAGAAYQFDYVFDHTVGNADVSISICREKITSGNIQTWLIRLRLSFFAAGTTTTTIKFYLFASSPGTISVVDA